MAKITLCVAEKPSVAKAIAEILSIGTNVRKVSFVFLLLDLWSIQV
jgi:DNA topoisomerase IA